MHTEQRESSKGSGGGIAANAVAALGMRLTSAVFTAVLTLYLVRALGPSGYGLFALAGAVGGLVLLPADFGVSQASSRFVAGHRGDAKAIAAVVGAAIRLKLVISVGFGVLLFVLSPTVAAAYGADSLVWPLRVIAVSIVAQSFMTTFSYVLIALARTPLNIPIYFVQSALETGLGIGLVAFGGGAGAALAGRATGYVVAAVLAVVLLRRVIGVPLPLRAAPVRAWMSRVFRYGGALVIVDSAYTLFSQVDPLIIGAFLNTRAVGLYAAPARLLALLGLPASALATAVAPRLADAEEAEMAARRLVGAAQLVAYLQVSAVVPMLLWPHPIALALGHDFAAAASVIRAFAPFAFLLGFGLLFSVSANYLGHARSRIPVAIATGVINVIADLVLIPIVGVVGGAIGTDIAYALYAPAHLWICRRSIEFPLFPLLLACGRAVLAGGGMAAAMLLVAGADPALGPMIAGLVAGLGAYAVVLWATGAVGDARRRLRAA